MHARRIDAWWNGYDRKPPITILVSTLTRNCVACGAEFHTTCRHKVRCDACQSVHAVERQKKANERSRQKRLRRRMGGIGL